MFIPINPSPSPLSLLLSQLPPLDDVVYHPSHHIPFITTCITTLLCLYLIPFSPLLAILLAPLPFAMLMYICIYGMIWSWYHDHITTSIHEWIHQFEKSHPTIMKGFHQIHETYTHTVHHIITHTSKSNEPSPSFHRYPIRSDIQLGVELIDLKSISPKTRSEWAHAIQQQLDIEQQLRDDYTNTEDKEEEEQVQKESQPIKSSDTLAPPKISQPKPRRRQPSPSPSRSPSPSPSPSPTPSRSPSPSPTPNIEDPRHDADPGYRWWGSYTGVGTIEILSAYQQSQCSNGTCMILRIYDEQQSKKTIALAMITLIPELDWALYIPGKTGSLLRKILGTTYPTPDQPTSPHEELNESHGYVQRMKMKVKNIWKSRKYLLTRKFGMVCTQWPFRSSVFRMVSSCDLVSCECSSHDLTSQLQCHSNAEGRLFETLMYYNTTSPDLQCDTLLFMSQDNDMNRSMFHHVSTNHGSNGSLISLSLPSTYVVDLRPYHGLDLHGYTSILKKHGKRIRLAPFEKAQGKCEIIHQNMIQQQQLDNHLQLQQYVAEQHQREQEPPIILQPNMSLIQSLAQNHAWDDKQKNNKKILEEKDSEPGDTTDIDRDTCTREICQIQLGENHEVMAQSILFRFGQTLLTTDLSGMDHERLNAFLEQHKHHVAIYSVKLLLVLEYALKQKIDFLEYGATTGHWKLEAGATSVPLIAGFYMKNVWLRWLAKHVTDKLMRTYQRHVHHTHKIDQNHNNNNNNNNNNNSNNHGKDNENGHEHENEKKGKGSGNENENEKKQNENSKSKDKVHEHDKIQE